MKKFYKSIRFYLVSCAALLIMSPLFAQEWENIQPMDSLPVTEPWRSRDAVLDFSEIRQDPDYASNNVLYINDYSGIYQRGSFRYDWRLNTELGIPADEGNEVAGITMVFRAKPTTQSIQYADTTWWWYVSIRASGPVGYHTEMRASTKGFELVGCSGQIPLVDGESIYYPIDTAWHTYRVTVIQRDVKIYIDEDPEPIIATQTTCVDEGGNQLRIGKQDRGKPYGGMFDYFLILEGAVYAPGEGPAIPDGLLVGPGGNPVSTWTLDTGKILQAYPNPAGENLTLSFHQEREGIARVDLYSLSGQKLATPYMQELPAGRHEVRISTEDLAAGVYLLSMNGAFTKFIKE
jgi:hypothetical protein